MKKHAPPFALIAPVLLVLLIGAAPFAGAVLDSFFSDGPGGRNFAGLANYAYIFSDQGFSFSVNITILWSFLSVALTLPLGFLLAVRLAHPGKGSNALYRVLFIPWGIPIYIAVPLWRAFLYGNGGISVLQRITGLSVDLMNDPAAGFLSCLSVSLWLGLPLTAFLLAGQLAKVNKEVVEAARIDGAGDGEIARYLYLPELKEMLLLLGLLNFIKAFKEFTLVFLMTSGGPPLVSGITDRHIIGATTTLGVFLYELFLQRGDLGLNAAYALVMAAALLYLMLYWGGVKKGANWRFFIVLTLLTQLPGGGISGLITAAALVVVLIKPRFFPAVAALRGGQILFAVAAEGFLRGFHPGAVTLLIIIPVLYRRKRKNSTLLGPALDHHLSRIHGGRLIEGGSRLLALVYAAATAAVLFLLVWMSLSRISACYIDSLIPPLATVKNFFLLFSEEGMGRTFLNTLVLAGITALALPFIAFPGAVYLVNRGKKATLLFLGALQLFSLAGGIHSLVPLYALFRRAGLIDTYLPLILIYLYHGLPFALFVLTGYLETLPPQFRDLALLEGVKPSAYTWKILVPLSLPPVITASMVAFLGAWNGFTAPLLFINSERLYPVSLRLYSWVGSLGSGAPLWNLFAAASLINTAIITLLFIRFKNPMKTTPLGEDRA